MQLHAPLPQLFTRSRLMILDFNQIPPTLTSIENIQTFFEACTLSGHNPRLPQHRQRFNNQMLEATGARYLVSRYGEDRAAMLAGSAIAAEGRTLHMGIDIFSKDLETVYAPCDGRIVRTGREPQDHGYGNYLILQPAHLPGIYFFFGHLAQRLPRVVNVRAGQPIAALGDYHLNENGGWSRHLHLQVLTELPLVGETPIGYSSRATFARNSRLFPDPMLYFPNWRISGGS